VIRGLLKWILLFGFLALFIFVMIPGLGIMLSAFSLVLLFFVLVACFAIFTPAFFVVLSFFCQSTRLDCSVTHVFYKRKTFDAMRKSRHVKIKVPGRATAMTWPSDTLKLGESIVIEKRGWVYFLHHEGVTELQIVL